MTVERAPVFARMADDALMLRSTAGRLVLRTAGEEALVDTSEHILWVGRKQGRVETV